MFKKKSKKIYCFRVPVAARWMGIVGVIGLLSACRTIPLPPVDLAEPGWKVREGQAVWRSHTGAPDIAGELILATRGAQTNVVQFIKTPLPLIVAQTAGPSWQVHIIPNDKTYSGRGHPPRQLMWLYLPSCLAGKAPPDPWHWTTTVDGNWSLTNWYSGESLEGYLGQ